MPVKCFMADAMPEGKGDYWSKPGAIFPVERSSSSPEGGSLMIVLPDGNPWCVDGWEISGDAPNLTARPSVDSGTYHGWLTDGVFSDDLEGRTYPRT